MPQRLYCLGTVKIKLYKQHIVAANSALGVTSHIPRNKHVYDIIYVVKN